MTKLTRRELNKLLKYAPKTRDELLGKLLTEVDRGSSEALALAYLISELCPDDRTTKHVFERLTEVE